MPLDDWFLDTADDIWTNTADDQWVRLVDVSPNNVTSASYVNQQQVSNGTFDSATTGWTAGNAATLDSVAGGVSGNCLRITTGGSANATAQSASWITIGAGETVSFEFYVKEGTTDSYSVEVLNNNLAQLYYSNVRTASAAWQRMQGNITTPGGTTGILVYLVSKGTAGSGETIFFDNVSVRDAGVTRIRLITPLNVVSAAAVTDPVIRTVWAVKPNDVVSGTAITDSTVAIGLYGDVFIDTADDSWVNTATDAWYPDIAGTAVQPLDVVAASVVTDATVAIGTYLVQPLDVVSAAVVTDPVVQPAYFVQPLDVVSASAVTDPDVSAPGIVDVQPLNVVSASAVTDPTVAIGVYGVVANDVVSASSISTPEVGRVGLPFEFVDDASWKFVDDAGFIWSPFAEAVDPLDVVSASAVTDVTPVTRVRLVQPLNVVSAATVTDSVVVNVEGVEVTPLDVVSAAAITDTTVQQILTVTPLDVVSAATVTDSTLGHLGGVNPNNVVAGSAVTDVVPQRIQDVDINNVVAASNVIDINVGKRGGVNPNDVVSATSVGKGDVRVVGVAYGDKRNLLLLKVA